MTHSQRHYSFFDQICLNFDRALKTISGHVPTSDRSNPADGINDVELSKDEKKEIAGLMRINHCGEVCAQALYQGQALTAQLPTVRLKMEQAALEENDHLLWCSSRLDELNSHTSYTNPLWYFGSFTIGALAGLAGDKWSLGFVAETEFQVVKHLEGHLDRLPFKDIKSRVILETMKEDEMQHAHCAIDSGAAKLPKSLKFMMENLSKLMTSTTYYI